MLRGFRPITRNVYPVISRKPLTSSFTFTPPKTNNFLQRSYSTVSSPSSFTSSSLKYLPNLSRLLSVIPPKGSKKLFPNGLPNWLKEGDKKPTDEESPEEKRIIGPGEPVAGPSNLVFAFLLTVLGFFLFVKWMSKEITFNWADLKQHIINHNVEKITIHQQGRHAYVDLFEKSEGSAFKKLAIPQSRRFIEKLEGLQEDMGLTSLNFVPVVFETGSFLGSLINTMIPVVIIAAIFFLPQRLASKKKGTGRGTGMGITPPDLFGMGNSRIKQVDRKNLTVRFKDVAGMDEAKQEVMEFVQFLKTPAKFRKLGAKIPKGALLVGPPGTGKTMLAKAIAGEAEVPFFSISGSDFVEMFVGVGSARVRDLFAQARAATPCIIWIDEIDAIGRSRASSGAGGNDERENTLNQLLIEMDGFDASTNVVVLAGTNRADVLDKALLRPGRFDRHISVDLPDIIGRKDIFKVHLEPIRTSNPKVKTEFAKNLAALTPSFSGADIANVCNEAALIAARHDKTSVEFVDFEAAIERVIAGLERKSRVLSNAERVRVAYHEAGHAIAGWFLEHAYPLLKVSIIPRGLAALGYAQLQPRDQHLYSVEQFNHQVCTLLAGRAAEELFFNSISTGARDDLEKVTQIIYGQLVKYGMNKTVGTISFPDESGHLDKSYSEQTAQLIDSEAHRMVTEAYAYTKQLLQEKKDLVERVAQHLLKHEVLRRSEMVELVGPRPFPEQTTYEQLLGSKE